MIEFITGDLGQWLIGIVVAALAFFGYGAVKKREGRKVERNKRNEERLDAIKQHQKTEKEIANAGRDSVLDINSKP